METILRENRFEMTELKKERNEWKTQLKSLSEQINEYKQRESIAHSKIQESLQMIESATAERNAAQQREKEIRGWNDLILDIENE